MINKTTATTLIFQGRITTLEFLFLQKCNNKNFCKVNSKNRSKTVILRQNYKSTFSRIGVYN